jgi:RNA polymerase sigma-70 factor (ECF subfamily)
VNPHEFRDAFETCRDPVFRFLLRICRHPTDAEDLLQDTFVMLWRKRSEYDGRGSLLGYLRRIAYRLYLNKRTKASRRAALAAHAPPRPDRVEPETALRRSVSDADLVARVRQVVAGLPDGARETFVLHRFEGLTCQEISQLMNAPVKTVESRLRRATQAVAQQLGARGVPAQEVGSG